MRIADLPLGSGAALAPMAGVTDAAMRGICARFGAVFTVSEMVSAKALVMSDKKSRRLMLGGGGSAPYGVQLFGAEPDTLAEAVRCIEDIPFDFVDINMGCPAPKIVQGGQGSALLKNPALAGQIAAAVVVASPKPVTAKLRIGWDEKALTGKEVALRCENAGVALLSIHARTREEMYRPGVHYDIVAEIKQAVKIPVLLNGDITDGPMAAEALRQTGCDGVMVGRGAMGRPWVFRDITAALRGEEIPPPPPLTERFALLDEQVQALCRQMGEENGMRHARGVAAHYMRGLRGAAALRRQAVSMSRYADLAALLAQAYDCQQRSGIEEDDTPPAVFAPW